MEEDYQKLLNFFLTEPSKAIEESKKMICSISNFDSYKKFEEFHSQHKIVTNCDENLFSTQLTVLCFNCSTNHSFTVCLSCFLKGNHEGHFYQDFTDTVPVATHPAGNHQAFVQNTHASTTSIQNPI